MQPQTQSETTFTQVNEVDMATTELDVLTLQGFTDDEVTSLLWLRQWYQNGGSDRMEVVRRLEFLKHLMLHRNIAR